VVGKDARFDFNFLKFIEFFFFLCVCVCGPRWMCSILENVPWALEKKVYSSAFGWNILKISVRSILSNVSFKVCISLLIFSFDDLSIGISEVLKSLTVLLSISPLMSASLCLM